VILERKVRAVFMIDQFPIIFIHFLNLIFVVLAKVILNVGITLCVNEDCHEFFIKVNFQSLYCSNLPVFQSNYKYGE